MLFENENRNITQIMIDEINKMKKLYYMQNEELKRQNEELKKMNEDKENKINELKIYR